MSYIQNFPTKQEFLDKNPEYKQQELSDINYDALERLLKAVNSGSNHIAYIYV